MPGIFAPAPYRALSLFTQNPQSLNGHGWAAGCSCRHAWGQLWDAAAAALMAIT